MSVCFDSQPACFAQTIFCSRVDLQLQSVRVPLRVRWRVALILSHHSSVYQSLLSRREPAERWQVTRWQSLVPGSRGSAARDECVKTLGTKGWTRELRLRPFKAVPSPRWRLRACQVHILSWFRWPPPLRASGPGCSKHSVVRWSGSWPAGPESPLGSSALRWRGPDSVPVWRWPAQRPAWSLSAWQPSPWARSLRRWLQGRWIWTAACR